MNDTTTMANGTLPTALSPDLSLEFRIVKISIYVVIFILTIIGNGLVISVIFNDGRMRSSSHILVLNLAICDLITPTISLPFDLAYEELKYHWPFGSVMCKLLWPTQTLSTTSSAFILTAICIDRYRALVFPFKVRWAGKFCLMICTMYIISVLVVIPYAFVLRQENVGEVFDCTERWPNPQKKFRQAYTMLLCILQYFLPLFIMISLYTITLRSLFNSTKSLPGIMAGENPALSHDNRQTGKRVTLKDLRKEQHFKVTKMFITVVIVFAISMFPNQVLWLWVDYGNLSSNKYFSMSSIICRIFTYSNSVLNPFIYGLYSKDFRKGYRIAGRRFSKVRKRNMVITNQVLNKSEDCGSVVNNNGESKTILMHSSALKKSNGTSPRTRGVVKKVQFSPAITSAKKTECETIILNSDTLENHRVKSSNIEENSPLLCTECISDRQPRNLNNHMSNQRGLLKCEYDILKEKEDRDCTMENLETECFVAFKETSC